MSWQYECPNSKWDIFMFEFYQVMTILRNIDVYEIDRYL